MRKYYSTLLLALAAGLMISLPAFATIDEDGGGWPQPKKKGFFKVGHYFIKAENYFSPNGDVIPIADITFQSVTLYGEYGFTDRLTGIVNLPVFMNSSKGQAPGSGSGTAPGSLSSIGDFEVGVKYGLTPGKKIAVSATLTFGIPTGAVMGETPETVVLSHGDGEFNQMVTIDASTSFNSGKAYASSYVGYNNRTQGFNSEFRYGFEAGIKPIKKLWVILRLNGVLPLGDITQSQNVSTSIFGNGIEYLSFSPEVSYDITDKWGASLGFGGAIYAKKLLAAPAFSSGIYYKL